MNPPASKPTLRTALANGQWSPGLGSGVIATNDSGTLAVGLYGYSRDYGAGITGLSAGREWATCSGAPPPDTGEFDYSTTILLASVAGPFAAGPQTATTWLMSGSKAQVEAYMQTLYDTGAR